jgi:uncharacterized protein (TIGR02246 family)
MQMKPLLIAMIGGAFLAAASNVAAAEDHRDLTAIEDLLSRYEVALNASDTNKILTLYADDGVFMAQNSPPNVGAAEVRGAYDAVFAAIDLNIEFQTDEIVQLSPQWAFARTRSEGLVTINATGDNSPEANQELFIFTKIDSGAWKIARYIFSTTNPPRP